MIEIIPAILPKTFEEIEAKVGKLGGNASMIQIDILDGTYTTKKTWPYEQTSSDSFDQIIKEEIGMPDWENINYELDLMMRDPGLDQLIKIGPTRIIFHLGALSDPRDYFSKIDPYFKETIELGIAVKPSESLDTVCGLIDERVIKFVQCMGIDTVGAQGNPFDERVLDHIRALRAKYPDMPIAVDGSVNRDTAGILIDAGATRLIIGSAIFNSKDPLGEYEYFKSL